MEIEAKTGSGGQCFGSGGRRQMNQQLLGGVFTGSEGTMGKTGTDHLYYDHYNREERYLCAHLFRLLHEPNDNYRALRLFVGDEVKIDGFRIFAEVALIRDAYYVRRKNPSAFMDELVRRIAEQAGIEDGYLLYSALPENLRTPKLTHPRQIMQKGADRLNDKEKQIYRTVQEMFHAKPDLVICAGRDLLVYEAKLTQKDDKNQFARTNKIAQVWAQLLHHDLGFDSVPNVRVLKLGLAKSEPKPDVSWEFVKKIAEEMYPENDRSRRALAQAVLLEEGEE
jgi:hypothetical protein